jgi:hypothetical protein
MKKHEKAFLMAAVAGITMGLSAPSPSAAEEKTGEVKCWGVNSCGSHAKCSVKDDDIKAFQALLGEKEYAAKFSKTTTHGCGSSAKCGASSQILNWTPTSAAECKTKGGYVMEESGTPKVKTARKA